MLGGQAPFLMRLPCHEQQALIAEERYPARRFWIGLGERADQRVALIAEPLAPRGMEASDQLARMALDAWSDPAAVMRDEVHHEQVRLGMVDQRDGKVREARELAKHVSLELEARLAALPRLAAP